MPFAALQIHVPQDNTIDVESGTIKGCRLAEVNRVARFQDMDGKAQEMDVTPKVIEALLSLAVAKEKLTAHWTHDRLLDEDRDYLSDSVGFWSGFRKDEEGNLIADVALEPGQYRDRILWKAKHHPQGIMASLVFDYNGTKADIKPLAIDSADFVQEGAATTALLRRNEPKKGKLMLDDADKKAIADMISSAIKEAHDAASATVETAADVTDADKLPTDDALPASMRSMARMARAHKRQIAAVEASAVTKAEAKFAAHVGTHGKGGLNEGNGKNGGDKFEAAITAAMSAGAKTRAVAIRRVANDNPELYAANRGYSTGE